MPSFSARAPLFGSLLLYFILTAALIARVPWGAAPDEAAHANYIEAIAATRALPVFAGQSPPAPGYEFHQPPLFYLLAAPLWASTPAGVQNYSGRVLSLAFGLILLVVVWKTANLVFGRASRASAICTLGAALSPLHQGIGAGVNNDALAGLWSACLFGLVARAWLDEPTKRVVVLTGVVAGLGALTKLTALPLGLWAFVAIGAAIGKRGERPILRLLPGLGIALVLAAPMLLRNQSLYGDPFAYRMFSRAAGISPGLPDALAAGIPFSTYALSMAWQIFGTTWGLWGGPNTLLKITNPNPFAPGNLHLPDPLWLLPLSVLVFVPLWGVWLARKNRAEPNALSSWWSVGVALLLVLWANFAVAHFAGGQARYLHGAFLPLVLLVGDGLSRTRSGTLAAIVMAIVMIGLTLTNIFVWKTLV